MVAELNEAYSILRNPKTRREYDQVQQAKELHHASSPPPPPHPEFESGELTPGQVSFASLPKNVQERLYHRQENKGQEQFQVKLGSVVWNYVFIGVLLCWFWYLFAGADGAKWKSTTASWYIGVTLAVGFLIGLNIVKVTRWIKATLKPYFYITPIYFIKTEYDLVNFYPIWTLMDAAVTHNYRNGSYQSSHVILKFGGYEESVTLSSQEQVSSMLERMRVYDTRLRMAHKKREYEYFRNNDDFLHVPRSHTPAHDILSKAKRLAIYCVSVLLSGIVLYAAMATNDNLSRERWVRHPAPPKYTLSPGAQRPARSSYPEKPLPHSGSVQLYTNAAREAPLEIKAAEGTHHFVKLVDNYSHAPVLTVFLRGGTTINIEVPFGTYEVRYASGQSWHGYEYLFGPHTTYSRAERLFTFQRVGNEISGFSITLYQVAHGNLPTSAIRPTDF